MIRLASAAEGKEIKFTELKVRLENAHYTLGGNWDYDGGSFDRALDEKHKVWLRLPFEVVDGKLDGENSENNAMVKLGSPYLLKHIYNEGNDPEASVRLVGAMFDQFQAPVDPDADIESSWVEAGKRLVSELDALLSG